MLDPADKPRDVGIILKLAASMCGCPVEILPIESDAKGKANVTGRRYTA